MTRESERRANGVLRVPYDALIELCGQEPGVPLFEGRSVEVSERGLHVRTSYVPELGAPLVLRFEDRGREVLAEGEVAWAARGAGGADGGGEFGIRFTALDAQSVGVLSELCAADDARESSESSPHCTPGEPVRLYVDGAGAPMKARVRTGTSRTVNVGSELGMFRVGRRVEIVGSGGERAERTGAKVEALHVVVDPGTGVPELVVTLRYDAPYDDTPEPAIIDKRALDAAAPSERSARTLPVAVAPRLSTPGPLTQVERGGEERPASVGTAKAPGPAGEPPQQEREEDLRISRGAATEAILGGIETLRTALSVAARRAERAGRQGLAWSRGSVKKTAERMRQARTARAAGPAEGAQPAAKARVRTTAAPPPGTRGAATRRSAAAPQGAAGAAESAAASPLSWRSRLRVPTDRRVRAVGGIAALVLIALFLAALGGSKSRGEELAAVSLVEMVEDDAAGGGALVVDVPLFGSVPMAAPADTAWEEVALGKLWGDGMLKAPGTHRAPLLGTPTTLRAGITGRVVRAEVPGTTFAPGGELTVADPRVSSVLATNGPNGASVIVTFAEDVPGFRWRVEGGALELLLSTR